MSETPALGRMSSYTLMSHYLVAKESQISLSFYFNPWRINAYEQTTEFSVFCSLLLTVGSDVAGTWGCVSEVEESHLDM